MSKLRLLMLAALIFSWPLNLFFKFAENTAYVHGAFVDYLVPKLFVSDLVIAGLFISWIMTKIHKPFHFNWQKWLPIIGGWAILSTLSLFVSSKPLATLWYVIKIGEMLWLATYLMGERANLKKPFIQTILLVTFAFQAMLGLLQFVLQRSIFPSYLWFGETRLETYAGITKAAFAGVEKILPYGTTAHPNILGGFLAIGILWCLIQLSSLKSLKSKFPTLVVIGLAGLTLFLTQSHSAWLTLGCGSLLLLLVKLRQPQLITGFALFLLSGVLWIPILLTQLTPNFSRDASFARRVTLNQAAVTMMLTHPWFGVGLNGFTANVETFLPRTEITRFIQPVHHIGLLLLSEVGIVGATVILVVSVLTWKTYKQTPATWYPLSFVVPVIALDHYFLTNQVGLLSLVFIFIFMKMPVIYFAPHAKNV